MNLDPGLKRQKILARGAENSTAHFLLTANQRTYQWMGQGGRLASRLSRKIALMNLEMGAQR
jgi:hypothetical protein